MAKVPRRITTGYSPAQRKSSASFPLQPQDGEPSLRSSKSDRLTKDAEIGPVNPASPSHPGEQKSGRMRSARTSASTDGSLGSRPSDLETDDPGRDDSERVGYGKPPRHSRFKPGQSGNPKGRAKSIKNFANILKEELETLVEVTENGRKRKLSKGHLAIKGLVLKAVKGDHRALAEIFRQTDKHSRQSSEIQQISPGVADDVASAMSPMRDLTPTKFREPARSHGSANIPGGHKC